MSLVLFDLRQVSLGSVWVSTLTLAQGRQGSAGSGLRFLNVKSFKSETLRSIFIDLERSASDIGWKACRQAWNRGSSLYTVRAIPE